MCHNWRSFWQSRGTVSVGEEMKPMVVFFIIKKKGTVVGTRTDSLKCARYRRMLCYSIMDGYHQEMDDYQLKYFTAMCCIMHGICSSMTIHYLIAIIQKYTSLLLQRILIEVELTDWHATKDKIATYLFGWAGYQGINFYGLYARRISFEIWIVFFV